MSFLTVFKLSQYSPLLHSYCTSGSLNESPTSDNVIYWVLHHCQRCCLDFCCCCAYAYWSKAAQKIILGLPPFLFRKSPVARFSSAVPAQNANPTLPYRGLGRTSSISRSLPASGPCRSHDTALRQFWPLTVSSSAPSSYPWITRLSGHVFNKTHIFSYIIHFLCKSKGIFSYTKGVWWKRSFSIDK